LGTQLHKFCKALDRPELEAFEPSTTAKVVELAKRFPKVGGGGQKRNSKQEGKFKSSKSESSGAKTSVSGTRKDDRATWKKRNITCFQCNQKGHYKNECPGVAKGSDKEESKSQSSSNGENEQSRKLVDRRFLYMILGKVVSCQEKYLKLTLEEELLN